MKKILVLLVVSFSLLVSYATNPKREFRGAWIQCVNGQYLGKTPAQIRQMLSDQLDTLQQCGINAILFQVRAEGDALYKSSYEPWSRYLTGTQGVAPADGWDPLAWMVEQCHQRGMELHAWINPYRAKTKVAHPNARNHVIVQHPEWTFQYDGLTLLNPARKECRDYICDVVKDIVARYDVDGLHIDDYFYPYPAPGAKIPDDADYAANSNGIQNRGDWRRYNVDLFIQQLYKTVHQTKPWVKVGISPFGIYRNKKSDPNGSNTNGLQNYDDLYADVLLWDANGWMDYCVPQIYWEIGNKAADYDELIHWWSKHITKTDLYIGEDVERTVKYSDLQDKSRHQLSAKMSLHRQLPNVRGTVLWYAKAAVDNVGNYGTSLRNIYWRTPALQPVMNHLSKKTPKKARKVKVIDMEGQRVIFWTAPKAKDWHTEAVKYVVYRFDKGERVNLDDASKIVAVTGQTFYEASVPGIYVVTALNRVQGESKGAKVQIKY